MAKTREYKSELLNQYQDLLSNNSGYILVDTGSLSTLAITSLKKKLNEAGSTFTVVKNTILKIAISNSSKDVKATEFDGPTAIISVGEDPSITAKLIKEAQTETKLLGAKSGMFKGDFLTAERVMQLAEIPSREVLLSKLLGSLNAPLSGFMNATTGNVRGLVMVLKGISEKK